MTQDVRFWEVNPAASARDTWVVLRDDSPGSDVRVAEAIASGETTTDPIPLVVSNRGQRRGDLLHATGEYIVVASDAFCELLEGIHATGWTSVRAEIRYKNGEELAGYRLLATTGRCADFRDSHHDDDAPEEPVDVSVGWDGSDLFWWRPAWWSFLVTDRVKRAIEDAGLQRIVFEVSTS